MFALFCRHCLHRIAGAIADQFKYENEGVEFQVGRLLIKLSAIAGTVREKGFQADCHLGDLGCRQVFEVLWWRACFRNPRTHVPCRGGVLENAPRRLRGRRGGKSTENSRLGTGGR
jgi:hypothetical protein